VSDKIVNVQDDQFDSLIKDSKLPVLVDFWAEWCAPCKMIAPILDQVAEDYDGKVTIAKVNVDEARSISVKFGVRSIPTLMLFKNGEVEDTKIGMVNKAQLSEFLDPHV